MPLLGIDLDNIEAAARGDGGRVPFTRPADTLKLVAEVRALRARLKDIATMVGDGCPAQSLLKTVRKVAQEGVP